MRSPVIDPSSTSSESTSAQPAQQSFTHVHDIKTISRTDNYKSGRRTKRLSQRLKKLDRPAEQLSPKVIEDKVKRSRRRRLFSFSTLGWSVTDAIIAFGSILAGYGLSPVAYQAATSETSVKLLPCAITFAMILVPLAHVAGLHDPRRRSNVTDLLVRSCLTCVIAMAILTLGWMLSSFLRVGRFVAVLASATTIISMIMTRVALWNWSSNFKTKICFIGTNGFSERVTQFMLENPLSVTVSEQPSPDINLGAWAASSEVDEVVFESAKEMPDDLGLLDCLGAGVKVSEYSDFIEENYQRILVEKIDANWLFAARLDLAHPYYGVKRLLDVVVAAVGIVLSMPLILLSALAIRFEGRGPVFYSQVRVGRFNKPFRIYKLRTMRTDSEVNGAQWAKQNDSRITMVGKILRKTRLDELPQFWNVLRGDMSLIGPRPERPEFVGELDDQIPFYLQRHLVKPGLTGWAQINYPYGASVEDTYNKLTYDFYYIKNSSLGLDLQIFLRTIGTIMKGSR